MIFESRSRSKPAPSGFFADVLRTLPKTVQLRTVGARMSTWENRQAKECSRVLQGECEVTRPFQHRFLLCCWDDQENLLPKLHQSKQKHVCHCHLWQQVWMTAWKKEKTIHMLQASFFFTKMWAHAQNNHPTHVAFETNQTPGTICFKQLKPPLLPYHHGYWLQSHAFVSVAVWRLSYNSTQQSMRTYLFKRQSNRHEVNYAWTESRENNASLESIFKIIPALQCTLDRYKNVACMHCIQSPAACNNLSQSWSDAANSTSSSKSGKRWRQQTKSNSVVETFSHPTPICFDGKLCELLATKTRAFCWNNQANVHTMLENHLPHLPHKSQLTAMLNDCYSVHHVKRYAENLARAFMRNR